MNSSSRKKDGNFYSELVLITVLSLSASSMWIELLKKLMADFFNNSKIVLLLTALALTFISILTLYLLFSDPHNEPTITYSMTPKDVSNHSIPEETD